MKELFARLFARPILGAEVIAASCFANVLALASPLFVMQILRRYVSYGVDATLATLTTGVLIAIVLEFVFRQTRTQLAQGLSREPDRQTGTEGFSILTRAKVPALELVPPGKRQEIVTGTNAIETAYNATNINTVLDVPFALLFIFVLFLISPILAGICAAFLVVVFIGGTVGALSMRGDTKALMEASGAGSALVGTAIREVETVRAFNAGTFLRKIWQTQLGQTQGLRQRLNALQGLTQTLTQSATALMSVAVITVGAILVVNGELDVGALIGANILGARALQPISRFSQLGSTFANARESMQMLDEFVQLPLEHESGSAKAEYMGGLELRDLAFIYPGGNTPLFESLSIKLAPGSLLLVVGANSTGKTTLARLLIGMLEPGRGQILADGLDLNQVAMEWWRGQVIYLPQEPAFLNASIEDNLRVANAEVDANTLNHVIDVAGLREYLDESPENFATVLTDNGRQLSRGVRHRLALARALITDGKLAIFDEPYEGMDSAGREVVRAVILDLVKKGVTIVVLSHDENIVKGAHALVDLNVKPVPRVTMLREVTKSDADLNVIEGAAQ